MTEHIIVPNIKKLAAIIINKQHTKISFLDFLKINTAGKVNKEIQIKLKEYVPNIDNICIKFTFSTKLNAIKFHGKPVKIWPLTNSIVPNSIEYIKNETTTFFE